MRGGSRNDDAELQRAIANSLKTEQPPNHNISMQGNTDSLNVGVHPVYDIGDRVTCSMPNPDSQNVNADGPKTGIVLRSTFNSERGYIYQLKYKTRSTSLVRSSLNGSRFAFFVHCLYIF